MARLVFLCCLLTLFSACAEPPRKEMDQAQGAIDAAKAAGAEQYAPADFAAATDALTRAHEAVAQRDYRQALSQAIDSRTRGLAAAKAAGEARARTHGEVESLLAEASTLLTQARQALRDPALNRLPRRTLAEPRTAIDAAQTSVQEARTAANKEDYARARKTIDGVAARILAAITQIEQATATLPARRPR